MALYPSSPKPAHWHAPEILDPVLSFPSDAGYNIRRAKHRRPRRRWQVEYLGLTTADMRVLRNLVMYVRNGAIALDFFHGTAVDVAVCSPTTPVTLSYQHGLFSGMMVGVSNSPNPSINGGVFAVTVTSGVAVTLNGTTAAGISGTCTVIQYVPRARIVVEQDTFAAPTTLIGPEQVEYLPGGLRTGRYSLSVVLEELF